MRPYELQLFVLTAYDSNHRVYTVNGMFKNKSAIWDAKNYVVRYNCKDSTSSWGFDGTNMKMVKSRNPSFSLDKKILTQ